MYFVLGLPADQHIQKSDNDNGIPLVPPIGIPHKLACDSSSISR